MTVLFFVPVDTITCLNLSKTATSLQQSVLMSQWRGCGEVHCNSHFLLTFLDCTKTVKGCLATTISLNCLLADCKRSGGLILQEININQGLIFFHTSVTAILFIMAFHLVKCHLFNSKNNLWSMMYTIVTSFWY